MELLKKIGVACLAFGLVASVSRVIYARYTNETSYVYSPGVLGSPIVIGRYCSHFVAETGEIIRGFYGGNIFGDGTMITASVFSEINTVQPTGWFRRNIVPPVARTVFKWIFGIEVTNYNPETSSTIYNYMFDLNKINLGQGKDIEILRKTFIRHTAQFPLSDVVLFGDSRGAATTFNFIAEDHPAIACAIIEAPFDSIPHLLKHHWYCKVPYSIMLATSKDYKKEGPFPIDKVGKMPLNTPLLLVTSLRDEIVPYRCTMKLYCKLKKRGCKVHLLILKKSSHKGYMIGKDKAEYESCVHAFYRSSGVAHNVQLAEKGAKILAETEPSVEELSKKYKLNGCCADSCIV